MGEDALDVALRALRHRDRSVHDLERRLEAGGFSEAEREAALETLVRTGVVADARFACARAAALAARGAGDALVRHDLAAAGIAGDEIDAALAALDPESVRATRIVARRGASAKTARYLRAKGFAEDVVSALVAGEGRDELR